MPVPIVPATPLHPNLSLTPTVTHVEETPFGLPAQRLSWAEDTQASLYFVMQPQSAYILGIERGQTLSGSEILRAFKPLAEDRRIKVVGVSFDTIGFWEKMVDRQLVSDWCLDEPKRLLG